MRIVYLECFSGISGDMLLGAMVDAGLPFACLEATTAALNVGARLEMRKVSRGGLAATKVDVLTPDTPPVETEHSDHDHEAHTHGAQTHSHPHEHSHAPHRSLSAIVEIIRSTPLSDSVKQRAIRAFQMLGDVEPPSIPFLSKRCTSMKWALWTPSSISSAPRRALRRSA